MSAAVLSWSAAIPAACTKYTVAADDGGSSNGGNAGAVTTVGGNGGATAGGAGGVAQDAAMDVAFDYPGATPDAVVERLDASAPEVSGADALGMGHRSLGDTCGLASDCANGICTNGHCCMVSFCDTCMACTGAGGTCAAVAVNSTACGLGATQCLSGTILQTCDFANACTTGFINSTCGAGTVCERYPPATCVDPNWAEWPIPNGSLDVAAGAPNLESYTDNGDGTVTDNVTGLMWQKVVPALVYSQPGAIAYCPTMVLGGHNDWRLPSIIELGSIVDFGQANPSIDATYFPATPADFFWSSSLYAASPSKGWLVSFLEGAMPRADATSLYSVRCVR
jgi:hypothetical protein